MIEKRSDWGGYPNSLETVISWINAVHRQLALSQPPQPNMQESLASDLDNICQFLMRQNASNFEPITVEVRSMYTDQLEGQCWLLVHEVLRLRKELAHAASA